MINQLAKDNRGIPAGQPGWMWGALLAVRFAGWLHQRGAPLSAVVEDDYLGPGSGNIDSNIFVVPDDKDPIASSLPTHRKEQVFVCRADK